MLFQMLVFVGRTKYGFAETGFLEVEVMAMKSAETAQAIESLKELGHVSHAGKKNLYHAQEDHLLSLLLLLYTKPRPAVTSSQTSS